MLKRLSFGVIAALPGSAALLVVMAPPWTALVPHTVVFGAGLGLLVGGRRHGLGAAFSLGMLLGLLDWVVWELTVQPLAGARIPTWTITAATAHFGELVGAVLQGAVAGIGFFALDSRFKKTSAPAKLKPRIVIVGGGFGGIGAAKRLDHLVARGLDAHVTVVSDSNFLLFTPLLVSVAASTLEARHVSAPVRAALRHASFLHGRAVSVDPQQRCVLIETGIQGPQQIPYDHLVLAVGTVPNFFDLPGVHEHAFPLKSIEDANRLRDHVLNTLEQADLESDPAAQARLLTFVVAGGGFAGTELVAELHDLVHDVLHLYPRLHGREPRFVLVHSGQRLLPELSEQLGEYARTKLSRRGVQFKLGARVARAGATDVTLSSGEVIAAHTLAWTAGNRPGPLVARATNGTPLTVDAAMRVPGADGMWALGDCARIPDGDGGTFPPTAQHATREGKAVADNIAAVLNGRQPAPFRFGGLGVLVSLGHRTAAGEIGKRQVSGFVGWILWRLVYLSKLPGAEKRLRVLADWTLDLVFPRDIALTSTKVDHNA